MSFVQTRFLGASISSFHCSAGWGGQPSALSVTLVEDLKNGDSFTPVPVGHPATFAFSNWYFRGLLQNWTYSQSSSGKIFNLTLQDPREILDGVKIILGGYTDPVSGVPNLLNVYGFLELPSFGASGRNEGGIPWKNAIGAVQNLTNGANPSYGGPISLRGVQYKVDLSQLPNLPTTYRISGETISLMDLITEICEAGSHDFLVTLSDQNIIVIQTISRTTTPATGLITAYISTLTEVTSSEVGLEFRNDTTGKFLVGGNKIDLFYTDNNNQKIWPFWGFKSETDFNLIVGTGVNDAHEFEVSSKSITVPGVGDKYKTNVAELRAALESQDSWEGFLEEQYQKGSASTNPHFTKYNDFNIIGVFNKTVATNSKQPTPSNTITSKKDKVEISYEALEDDHEEAIQRLYQFVRGIAQTYYGTKFMIQIPDVDAYIEPETDIPKVSMEPDSGGYLDPALFATAAAQNKIPQIDPTHPFLLNDGRIPPYVRYDNINALDFSEIPKDKIFYNQAKTSAFIVCDVEQGVAFENISTLDNPRVVITVPGVVRARIAPDEKTDFGKLLKDTLTQQVTDGNLTTNQKTDMINSFGIDNDWYGSVGLAKLPDLAVVPLKNNRLTYGPWYATGANGKLEFEQDDTLVPWNYNGYTNMNTVGNAKVSMSLSQMQQSETGSVEVPGAPNLLIGQQLIANGPYVTDVDVSVGPGGVTSVYRFSTWTPEFGRLSRANVDRLNRLSTKLTKNINAVKSNRIIDSNELTRAQREEGIARSQKTKRKASNSSHGMLAGEGFSLEGDELVIPNVFVQPHYNFTSQLRGRYDKKGGMSMDGMFRPFSTNPDASGIFMPRFEMPVSGAPSPNVNDLNPYSGTHDITVVIRGSSLPDDLVLLNDPYTGNDYRPMALRGPVVIAGWGYDVNGKPVPNESGRAGETPTDVFMSGYRQRFDEWKVGPLDTRWDNDRKVWIAGGTDVKIVRITRPSGASFPSDFQKVYYAQELEADFEDGNNNNVELSDTDNFLYVGNFRENLLLESGIYWAAKVNGKYYIDNQTSFNRIGF